MSTFLDIAEGREDVQPQAPQASQQDTQQLKRVQAADKKAQGIITVLDQIDNSIAKLLKQKAAQEKAGFDGELMPDVDKEIDRLSAKRGEFVNGLNNPAILVNMNISSIPNSELFMKTIDPRVYAELSEEKRDELRRQGAELDGIQNGIAPTSGGSIIKPTFGQETPEPRKVRNGLVTEATQTTQG